VKVIADQEIRVATLSGACVLFLPGVEREVSDEIGLLALQMGARQADVLKLPDPIVAKPSSIKITTEPASKTVEVEAFEEFKTLDDVINGMEKLVQFADPDDFKADGTPKASAVNRVVGRTVSTEDREAAWEAFLHS
jgi:hypothetical protein